MADGGRFGMERVWSGCGWALFERGLSAVWVAFGPFEAPLRHELSMKWEEAAPRQHWLARLRPLRSLYYLYSTGWSITTMPTILDGEVIDGVGVMEILEGRGG